VVESAGARVLIDCGFTLAETSERLAGLGLAAENLDAVLVTHEHGDHVGGVGPLARRHGVPVWMNAGTRAAARQASLGDVPVERLIPASGQFTIGDLCIEPVVVPHDARQPNQFIIAEGDSRLGILTDTGSITPHLVERYQQCDGLVLEFNHDEDMLLGGDYPPALRARIHGSYGHLSNRQSLEFLSRVTHPDLKQLVAAHLSERNNDPVLVQDLLDEATDGSGTETMIAAQRRPSGWSNL
jgi:phosphoribosyl 1,2-cyclic phosphodiesterase